MSRSWGTAIVREHSNHELPSGTEVDHLCGSSNQLWESISGTIHENVREGVSTCLLIVGDCAGHAQRTLEHAYSEISQSEVMSLLEITLSGTVSCFEMHNDRVLDVIGRENIFSDRKVRSGRVDGLAEAPFTDAAVGTACRHRSQPDSAFWCEVSFRWSNGIVTRLSKLTIMSIPATKLPDGKQRAYDVALQQVVEALIENATRKKKGFVPFRLSLPTQILAELIAGANPSHMFFVGVDTASDPAMARLVSRARAIHTIVRGSEEDVSDHDLKNTLNAIKRKCNDAHIAVPSIPQRQPIGDSDRLLYLQKEQAVKLTARRLEERGIALQQLSARLETATKAAARADELRGEAVSLKERVGLLLKELWEEERSEAAVIDSLEEAREVGAQVAREVSAESERRSEASQTRRANQARAIAGVFRTARAIGQDRANSAKASDDVAQLEGCIADLNDEISGLDEEVARAGKRYAGASVLARRSAVLAEGLQLQHDRILGEIAHMVATSRSQENSFNVGTQELPSGELVVCRDLDTEGNRAAELRQKLSKAAGPLRGGNVAGAPGMLSVTPLGELAALCQFEESREKLLRQELDKLRDCVAALAIDLQNVGLEVARSTCDDGLQELCRAEVSHERLLKQFYDLQGYVHTKERL